MFPTKSCRCLLGGSHSTVPVNSINSPVLSNLDVWGKPYKKLMKLNKPLLYIRSIRNNAYMKQICYLSRICNLEKKHTHNLSDLNQCKMNNEYFCGQTEKHQRINCLMGFSNPPLALVHFQHKGCQIRI